MDESERIRQTVQGSALRHAARRAAASGSGSSACGFSSHRLSTFWGGRVAQELERRPDVEVVVGVDTRDPRIALERTEFVRTDSSYSILSRIVAATQVDTIVHSHLIVDSTARERPHAARDQCHRHDGPARGGGARREPGAQGRPQELGSRVRREQSGSRTSSGKNDTEERALDERRTLAPRGRGVLCGTSPTTVRT
jgi:hypothetical protein